MPRKVKEWIAKHDDQKVPARVRLRIFDKYNGICQLSQTKILPGMAWELDHIKALWKGGEHREENLWPVLKKPHKEKSKREKSEKKREDRKRKKHTGITKPKGEIQSRGFAKTEKKPKIDKAAVDKYSVQPKRRSLFQKS